METTVLEVGGWGDDIDEENEEEYHSTKELGQGDAETGWDVEDADLEIPDLVPEQVLAAGNGNYIHLPTNGTSPCLMWTKNSQLPADHIMAGAFESACRLLNDQVIIQLVQLANNIVIIFLPLIIGRRC